MKDIYNFLNNIKTDFTNIKPADVNDIERKKDKERIINSIKRSSHNKNMKKGIIAAALLFFAINFTYKIMILNPAFASNIPIIGDLINNNLVSINSKYPKYINEINKTVTSNGISMTVENAAIDKNILFLSVVIKTDDDSISLYYNEGDNNELMNYYTILSFVDLIINGKEYRGITGMSEHEVIDSHSIRILQYLPLNSDLPKGQVNIKIKSPYILDGYRDMTMDFILNTKQIEKETYTKKINKTFYVDGVKCIIDEITVSPLTLNVKYHAVTDSEDFWLDFDVTDPKGNKLILKTGNAVLKGCSGYIKNNSQFNMNYFHSENLNEVTLTPLKSVKRDDTDHLIPVTDEKITIKLK